jgi:hypothetical protein
MIDHEQELERVLRQAPRPTPPVGLKDKLLEQIELTASPQTTIVSGPILGSWIRRWWPALVPAAISAACAIVLTVQQMEIQDLHKTIETLDQNAAAASATPTVGPDLNGGLPASSGAPASEEQEIARLKDLVNKLRAEVAALEKMRSENDRLRSQLAAPAGFLTREETAALEQAKEKAQSIQCVNNLKQLGLSLRVWALDNGDTFPPVVLEMTNEMSTPKILACPGDPGHQAADSWASYTPANCSYEYLAPSGSPRDPERVAFRCPVHGSITLSDGSVVEHAAKDHPNLFIQRDGKLYFGSPPPTDNPPK